MNHDITHCTGVKGDAVCEGCHRKVAHEDLLRLVRRGELASGEMHTYLSSEEREECVEKGHKLLWVLWG